MERLLSAVYKREPSVKVVVAVTGGGISATKSLFQPSSSSTVLHFAVPYSRASLQSFLSSAPLTSAKPKFCSADTSERMALAAWKQATEITRHEAEEENAQNAVYLHNALKRYRVSLGIACTAELASDNPQKGPHDCFLSVCNARLVSKTSTFWGPQCETYHLQLDNTLGRSRMEEDEIVSNWLVYLLCEAADVDSDTSHVFRDDLRSALTGTDTIEKLTPDRGPNDPLQEICNGQVDGLTCIAFMPGNLNDGEVATPLPALGFDFRGLVLPGSFNPLHEGHINLARIAQQLMESRTGIKFPVAFELAVANADKGVIESSTILTRIEQFVHGNSSKRGNWPMLVTNAMLFTQKAELLPGCTFVIGADTAVRILDKKYYEMDEHKMVLALDHIARNRCSFVVAGRFDTKVENRFISAEEVLEKFVPSVFRHLFVPIPESAFRIDISSSAIRREDKTLLY